MSCVHNYVKKKKKCFSASIFEKMGTMKRKMGCIKGNIDRNRRIKEKKLQKEEI